MGSMMENNKNNEDNIYNEASDSINNDNKKSQKTKQNVNKTKADLFMCSECAKQFRSRGELAHHNKSKCGTVRLFICKVCNQELMTAGSLYNHMLIHKGEKNFMCKFCAKLFLTAGQLKVHERKHTNERVYVCEVCNKGFCHRQSLITHSTIHTGIKPFNCENCGKTFSCVGNLIKHRKTHPDTCALIPLNNHSVKNPSTKIKLRINTPKTIRLKQSEENSKGSVVTAEDSDDSVPLIKLRNNQLNIDSVKIKRVRPKNEEKRNDILKTVGIDDCELIPISTCKSKKSSTKPKVYKHKPKVNIVIPESCELIPINGCKSKVHSDIRTARKTYMGFNINKEDNQKTREGEHYAQDEKIHFSAHSTENDGIYKNLTKYEIHDTDSCYLLFNNPKTIQNPPSLTPDSRQIETFTNRLATLEVIKTTEPTIDSPNCLEVTDKPPEVSVVETNDAIKKVEQKCFELENIEDTRDAKSIKTVTCVDASTDPILDIQCDCPSNINSSFSRNLKRKSKPLSHFTKRRKSCSLNTEEETESSSNSNTSQLEKGTSTEHTNFCPYENMDVKSNVGLQTDEVGLTVEDLKTNDSSTEILEFLETVKKHVNKARSNRLFTIYSATESAAKTITSEVNTINTINPERNLTECGTLSQNDTKKKIKCKYCDLYFTSNRACNDHLLENHASEIEAPIFDCKHCNKKFLHKAAFSKHMKTHIRDVEIPSFEDEYRNMKCKYCCKLFLNKEELKEHQQMDHGDFLTCQSCDKTFASEDSLKTHTKNIHGGNPRKQYLYVCEICGTTFKQKSQMMVHKENDCKKGPCYPCEECDKSFQNEYIRKTHMKTHSPEKPLTCKFCGKKFRWKGQLSIHERSHTGEKPFKCLFCPKAFAYRDSLITHSCIHTGVKPHFCTDCGWRFSCIGNLNKHMKTHARKDSLNSIKSKTGARKNVMVD